MTLYRTCVSTGGLLALVAALTGCGGAGAESDPPVSSGANPSVVAAATSMPLNVAIKPVSTPSTASTITSAAQGAVSGATSGVATVDGKQGN